jgi:uncharacterized protein (TIGR02266 family)
MGEIKNREHKRVDFVVEVSLVSEHNFYTGQSRNLSEGGIFVATELPPPRETEVGLKLTLTGHARAFELRGVVCWTCSRPRGCGIRFVELPPEALEAIYRFVREREAIYVPGTGA